MPKEDFSEHFRQLYADLESVKAVEAVIPAEVNARHDSPKARRTRKKVAAETGGIAHGLKLEKNPPQDYLREWESKHE
ncbi:MAG: hypothetical protein AAB767_01445 [Patescibacteria group bacterium]